MPWLNKTDLLVNPNEKNPNKRIVFRQIGWHGQTGRFYELDENPALSESGSFTPMYIQIAPE